MAGANMSKCNPDDPSTWQSVLGTPKSPRKLDLDLPNGMSLRNINTPEDIENAKKMLGVSQHQIDLRCGSIYRSL